MKYVWIMKLNDAFFQKRKLQTLVENQTTYSLTNAEMHVFETHQQAEQVLLRFDQPVLASMLTGKKVMHLEDRPSFDFLPGESLILPANELMCIDFPEARIDNPTRCLAMTISEEKIDRVVQLMNETMQKADAKEWLFSEDAFKFTDDAVLHQIIHRLLFYFTENHPSRDLFVEFTLKELIIRMLQTETKIHYQNNAKLLATSNAMASIVDYIQNNLDKSITVTELSRKAYMSESNFHRVFKNELGLSPIEFINEERLKKASALLRYSRKKVKEICIECGYNSLSYFTRLFKRKYRVSPAKYQKNMGGRV
ncbi:MAG: AraC family transcriptional regulator [Bacteroidota bacterium]